MTNELPDASEFTVSDASGYVIYTACPMPDCMWFNNHEPGYATIAELLEAAGQHLAEAHPVQPRFPVGPDDAICDRLPECPLDLNHDGPCTTP